MKVGVLALQGAFGLHQKVLEELGAAVVQVRTPEQLAGVDSLVIGGGESTTMSKLLDANHLAQPLAERLVAGMPTLGTCAGMILLASDVLDGYPSQHCFGAVDVAVRRNGYGRQADSFHTQLKVTLDASQNDFTGVFIRAPKVCELGDAVDVLAELDGVAVMCRQGAVVVCSFHPELTADTRIHRWFLEL